MLAKRIIPCPDVTGGRVVKGVNFVELRDAGDPVEIAARYNEQGADELDFPRHHGHQRWARPPRPSSKRWLRRCSFRLPWVAACARWLTSGAWPNAGADKSRASIRRPWRGPGHPRGPADKYGAQCIVWAAIMRSAAGRGCRRRLGRHRHGDLRHGVDAVAWAKRMAELGAGEILLTSMDRDGTKIGFDLALTRAVSDAVPVPVIASVASAR